MVRIGMLVADRYEVLEKIGTGGMSVVYRAKDHKLNRLVAIKFLKQEFSDNANFVSKFRVEAQAAAGLMHPNIVNVYDVGDEKGMHYIVMELVDGITLKKYIEKKARLSVKEAISIAIQVSMGLEAAHQNHIIHRDIKPQNIIISRDGKVKVTDFGIAKAATSNTITSNVMGSVHYTSPEQARGGYSDERSDIYSLGISIFEMLTGRVPFNGETTVAIAIKHIQSQMPSPREFVPDIPRSVEQIVMKCCEKSPDRRYQNMAELIADLKQSLLHPDDDFVRVIHPDEDGATRISDSREQGEIRRYYRDRDEYDEYDGEEEEDSYDSSFRQESQYDHYVEDDYPEEDEDPYDTHGLNDMRSASDAGRGGYTDQNIYRQERDSYSARESRREKRRYEDDYDDYDDGEYNPHKYRIATILAVIAAILIGAAVITYAADRLGLMNLGLFGESSTSEETDETVEQLVQMPAVVGQEGESVRNLLQSMGLTAEITYAESSEYAAGIVAASSISEGTPVPEGTTVMLTVSAGENGIKIPDVTGKPLAEAIALLHEKGFSVSREERPDDGTAKGSIVSQSPEAGQAAPSGSTISIIISSGPATEGRVKVPTLTGLPEEDATAVLIENKLSVGEVKQVEVTDPNLKGLVSSQSVAADTYVEEGTAVNLEIGKMSDQEQAQPEVSSYSYTEAIGAPTASEAPDYVPGTQVYVVLISADGQKLLDTVTTGFPIQTGFTGIAAPTGTLQMSYTSTVVTTDPNTGAQVTAPGEQKVVRRSIAFTPEQN